MASDPQPDRIRLVIEPDAIERAGARAAQDDEREAAPQRRPEDMIDLDRLEDDDEFADEYADDAPARRRVLPFALAGIALAGFGAVTWWAYSSRLGPAPEEAIPLIQADAGPIKSRPVNPGGMEVPYQDKLVLNEVAPEPGEPQVERLLPPPEVPQPPMPQAAEPAAGGGEAAPQASQAAEVAAPRTGSELGVAAGPTGPAAIQAEKPAVPAPPSQATAVLAPADPPAPARTPAVPPAPQAPAAASALPIQTAAGAPFLVQFASLKDRALVDGEWSRLRAAFSDLLGDKELVVQSVDLGARGTFHRVRAGYFADRDAAAALCRKVEAQKQACIVVKP